MTENPNYYSILPADVRYDKRLTPNAKLLYAEITALINMNGKCFATNSYFSNLYNVDARTITRWISSLVKCGYIDIIVTQDEEKKTIRYVQLCQGLPDKIVYPPHDKNVVHNNNTTNVVYNNNTLTESNIKEPLEKWLAYKKEKKQKYTPTGLKECIKKLERLSGNDPVIAMQIVEESMSNGWTGLFPLKDNKKAEPVISGKELYKQWFGNLDKGRENEVRESV